MAGEDGVGGGERVALSRPDARERVGLGLGAESAGVDVVAGEVHEEVVDVVEEASVYFVHEVRSDHFLSSRDEIFLRK